MSITSLEELCHRLTAGTSTELHALLPGGIQQEIGHFNVFDLDDLDQDDREKPATVYPCRTYYKISLLRGQSRIEYGSKAITINRNALVFSTPKVLHHWLPMGLQSGPFCVFTAEFMLPTRSGVILDEMPVFKNNPYPVFTLTDEEFSQVQSIFGRIKAEIASDYAYKYDLLRAYVLELIHFGQKLQPSSSLHPSHSASARMTSMFIELLERQFPIETPQQTLRLRTAKDYADHLAVHINHLNKTLKETTGLTTTNLIEGRIAQEAKGLLQQTDWSVSDIAYCLGFADVAHFSNFFKRQTSLSPSTYRGQEKSVNYTTNPLTYTNTSLAM
ncbi:transcriptional regulator, AraC family [Fibrisoma limi BUZ 3]|uniref:Transcriptional regulator, AraC family n=1 Tax=Fibrisoma limi BUZ 3 TaxID=1185876 RepID=I2GI46_9BACT|nr:helix-turn-helix transcriptional regulator [Fibrisoma limi]CCH53571.1 transcriptional regulator, AraC family [Fibrisoma limi BUZ 3]